MKREVSGGEQADDDDDLEIVPLPACNDLARGGSRKQDEEEGIDGCGRTPADPGRNADGNSSGDPGREQQDERPALQRQPSGPVRYRRRQEARDDRGDISKQHLMDVPVPRRERRAELELAVKGRQPHQDNSASINRPEEEERPEAIRKQ